MVQERITDIDSTDSSDCCDVNIPSHFSNDLQSKNSSVSASILKSEGSGRNSATSTPSTSESQSPRASPLIMMSESDSSHSNDNNDNHNVGVNINVVQRDREDNPNFNVSLNPASNSTTISSIKSKNHRNKTRSNYETGQFSSNNNNNNSNHSANDNSVKTTGASGNCRKLTEPQVENVPPTGIVVPRTVPCIVLTPPSLFSPATGVPLFSVDHMQGGKIPASDFTSVSARCAAAAAVTAASFSPFQLNHLVDKNMCHDGLKFKIENSLNLSQSCNNKDNDGKSGEAAESSKKLAFGIDRILSGEREKGTIGFNHMSPEPRIPVGHPMEIDFNLKSYHTQQVHHHSSNNNGVSNEDERSVGGNYPSQCSECFFLSRYCRRIQFPTTTPTSASTSFTWIPSPSSAVHPVDSSPPSLLSSTGFSHHQHVGLQSYGLTSTNFSNLPTMVSCNTSGNGRRKRSWSRAVFSNLQRKGLEKRFQLQKYITKPDRRQLAATLGLTDAQVKVWFQNRRMKWRHSKEGKQGTHIPEETVIVNADKK